MKRIIDAKQELLGFDGKPIAMGDSKNITLGDGLLVYLRSAGRMGLNDMEQNTAYALGNMIGQAEGKIELTTEQHKVLQKLADSGKTKAANGTEDEVWTTLEIKQGLKTLVDEAEVVKDEAKSS